MWTSFARPYVPQVENAKMERCDLCPMLNTITHKNVNVLDLHRAREIEHNNDLFRKNRSKWDEKDPKKSLTNIHKYFETFCGTSKAPCS